MRRRRLFEASVEKALDPSAWENAWEAMLESIAEMVPETMIARMEQVQDDLKGSPSAQDSGLEELMGFWGGMEDAVADIGIEDRPQVVKAALAGMKRPFNDVRRGNIKKFF